MRNYGYRVVDTLVEHFNTLPQKKPVAQGTREEMDSLFLEEAPKASCNVHEEVEKMLRESPKWEVVSSASPVVINFRYNPITLELAEKKIETLYQFIAAQITASREAILATTILNGQVMLRMCLINPRTTINDVQETLAQCESYTNVKLETAVAI